MGVPEGVPTEGWDSDLRPFRPEYLTLIDALAVRAIRQRGNSVNAFAGLALYIADCLDVKSRRSERFTRN